MPDAVEVVAQEYTIEILTDAGTVEILNEETSIVEILTGPAGADGTVIHVGTTPPENPEINDLWVDTN